MTSLAPIPWDLFLGALFIVVYALERFNLPPTNRAKTTAVRYYSTALLYCCIFLAFYLLFVQFPSLLDYVLAMAGDKGREVDGQEGHSVSVVAAMMLSVFLPKMPGLFELDKKLRDSLQKLAAIPKVARDLGGDIAYKARFVPSDDLTQKVRDELSRLSFAPEDVCLAPGDYTCHLWTRLTALVLQIRRDVERRDTGLGRFFALDQAEVQPILRRYDELTDMARNCFRLLRDIQGEDPENPLPKAVLPFLSSFRAQVGALFEDACMVLGEAVLAEDLTEGARRQELRAKGFELPRRSRVTRMTVHELAKLGGLLAALLLGIFVVLASEGRAPDTLLLKVVMIASAYTVAVASAVIPKQRWGFFRRDGPRGMRPYAAYLASGLLAAVTALSVTLPFKALALLYTHEGLAVALTAAWDDTVTKSYPWLFMAFVTAVVTAFSLDNRPGWHLHGLRLRLVESGYQMLLTVLAALLVQWWLSAHVAPGELPSQVAVLSATAVIGGLIGFSVPAWYRLVSRRGLGGTGTLASQASALVETPSG